VRVFISHTFEDEDLELAQKLQQILLNAGIDGYIAETRREYDKLIRDKIIAEIKNSDHMIAILTENSFDSASVNQELGYALREGISPIIMLEKKAKQGVLTFGIDPEEFTKSTFLESCDKILHHIQKVGPRERIPESVPEILKKLANIDSKLDNKIPQVTTTGYSNKYPEVQWYSEIIDYCNDGLPEETDPIPTEAKKCYSKIQMLRQELEEISKSYEISNSFQQNRLAQILRSKRAELKALLDDLREMWTQFSD